MGLAATSVVTTWETATFLSWQTQQQRLIPAAASSHHEMIPTLFSVVDPATALPLLALDNPLYKTTLRHAIFHQSPVDVNSSNNNNNDAKLLHHFWNIVELPTLSVDVVTVDGRRSWTPTNDKPSWPGEEATSTTSLTLTWTLGKDLRGHSVIRETENDDCTVLVWSCATEQPTYDDKTRDAAATDTTTATTTKPKKLQIVEAATVAQAQATSTALKSTAQHHSTTLGNTNRNEWRIPTIPSFLRRQSHCQVDMYQKIGPLEYVSLATVPIPLLGHVDTPFGIHLALTATPDRMLVQFVTGAPGTPVAQYRRQRPHHKTGYENDDDMRRVHGESTTYTAEDMCQAPANETAPGQFQPPGYLHAVALTNLEPNAVYTYQVGLETGQGVTWNSQWYGFVAALPAGDATEHSFIVYGDQGCPIAGWDEGKAWMSTMATRELGTSGSNNEITTMRSIHHFGDLSYAQGAAHHWDAWFDMIENVVAQVPLMVAVGNHEYDHEAGGDGGKDPSRVETDSGFMPPWGNFGNDSGGECGVPTSKRFTMPETGNGVYWYSYDYGLVHTIVISSEHDLSVGSPQHRWLEKDLHAADRSLTPWVVVESHRPFYEGERYWNDNTVGVAMRYEVEDLLFDYHVDLVLSGHYHAYHRT